MTDKKRPLREIVGSEVQEALDLSYNSFVDFALLLGTDFTTRIRMVGPNRALKFIKSHGSIEEIVKLETKYPPSFEVDDYLKQVSSGREIFKSLPKVPSPSMLKQTEPDEEYVLAVIERYGLSRAILVEEEDFFNVAFTNHYFNDNPHQD
jgi:flap endonuclease-1